VPLLLVQSQLRQKTSCTLLELAVLGAVDERVDTAVGQHQNDREMVIPASELNNARSEVNE